MKGLRLFSMPALLTAFMVGTAVLTASSVSATVNDSSTPPHEICRTQQENLAKQDKAFKALEDECSNYLNTSTDKKRQSPRSH
jgi:hypothetical protein